MYKYLLEQEQFLLNAMKTETNLEELYEYSKVQITWISHERLVHLLVLLFTSWLLITAFIGFMLLENLLIGIFCIILTILVPFYVVHYYRLENGIQRLYKISNQIHHRMSS
jgi:Flp pilus assembly protein TadB